MAKNKARDFLNNIGAEDGSFEQIEKFVQLLSKWRLKMNLVKYNDLEELYSRHILDSLQLLNYINDKDVAITDLGSGAGFPGLILSFAGIRQINLVEANAKKCSFLKQAASISSKKITCYNQRIEDTEDVKTDIITSRALAPLSDLLKYAENFYAPSCKLLFLKGENLSLEIKEAELNWQFEYTIYPSITSNGGSIIEIGKLRKNG
jgi:16S rRNA (guanine527-N7)-methyltransferase